MGSSVGGEDCATLVARWRDAGGDPAVIGRYLS